jgi:hypothetical protein
MCLLVAFLDVLILEGWMMYDTPLDFDVKKIPTPHGKLNKRRDFEEITRREICLSLFLHVP